MEIKKIKEKDLAVCAKLFLDVFSKAPWYFDWMEYESVEKYFNDLYTYNRFLGYYLVNDGVVIGCCLGSIMDYFGNVQYTINEIAVKSEMQGKGYGKAFMAMIEDVLKTCEDVNVIKLNTLKTIDAYHYYQKCGFNDVESQVELAKFI